MHRKPLLAALADYAKRWPDESPSTTKYREFVEREPQCFERATVEGHVTGSAWVVDQSGERVLFLLHRKLGKWLQPGGHADGETDTLAIALKEVAEETGLTELSPVPGIFDLDIHGIPARKSDPEHLHYDVRYALRLSTNQTPEANHESTDMRWFAVTEVANWEESSLARMARKWVELATIRKQFKS